MKLSVARTATNRESEQESSGGKTAVGIREGTLSRLGQECLSGIYCTGVGEYLPVAKTLGGTAASMKDARRGNTPQSSPKGQGEAEICSFYPARPFNKDRALKIAACSA
jgi:hypothetical protein